MERRVVVGNALRPLCWVVRRHRGRHTVGEVAEHVAQGREHSRTHL